MATKTMTAMITKPAMAPGFRRSRYQASLQRPVEALSMATSRASSSMTLIRSTQPDLRVQEPVGDVNDEIDEDDDDGDEHDAALDDGVVARLDRVDEPRPDSREGEDGLRQDGAREQEPDLETDDRGD